MPKIKIVEQNPPVGGENKGRVICYIGAGKGKTTAAMGLAVRASGAGMDVFILQFVKAQKSETDKTKEQQHIDYEFQMFSVHPFSIG